MYQKKNIEEKEYRGEKTERRKIQKKIFSIEKKDILLYRKKI